MIKGNRSKQTNINVNPSNNKLMEKKLNKSLRESETKQLDSYLKNRSRELDVEIEQTRKKLNLHPDSQIFKEFSNHSTKESKAKIEDVVYAKFSSKLSPLQVALKEIKQGIAQRYISNLFKTFISVL
jgi:hypothetical protein